ncbi:polymer-forming cytoskeletal protein [Luteimonas sp. RD2P54]|uniref:Polymer-forming cytoskeletal protein n=1 Tax=Luteimonas endophytica TaxID=3042023 RepID=A0ABT6J9K5_9GAMM|nr:polymer-forming cytoskeletal protein [Luteimonas endophytica]MDH5823429.1 polymer-forming cytoskeletal protein [Luteimonas endophytica]
MAIFNQPSSAKKDTPSFAPDPTPSPAPAREPQPAVADFNPTQTAPPRRPATPEVKESLIAANLTIEGKIEGTGHVRIAGKFKGDVNVQGDLTIEKGAKLNGGVRADKVIVAGELEGNIDAAARVELLDTAVMNGDLKAGSLTVAAGSRIRGHVECGWENKDAKAGAKSETRADKADLELAS